MLQAMWCYQTSMLLLASGTSVKMFNIRGSIWSVKNSLVTYGLTWVKRCICLWSIIMTILKDWNSGRVEEIFDEWCQPCARRGICPDEEQLFQLYDKQETVHFIFGSSACLLEPHFASSRSYMFVVTAILPPTSLQK